jgi:hypothetical protein
MVWTKGAGSYGDRWGYSGKGISVRQGGTIYIKFYSDVAGAGLYFAEHGRRWGEWHMVGPVLTHGVGSHPNEPVILRISDVGTAGSTVAWVNARDKSGIWSGLPAPGPYDLALHANARWTLPPIMVTEAPRRSFWSGLLVRQPAEPPPPPDAVHFVPDGGQSIALSALAVLFLAFLHRRT